MSLSIKDAQFVVARLLRPGESEATIRPVKGGQPQAEDPAAWERLLTVRFEAWQSVSLTDRYDTLPAGWMFAAVRLFGADASYALDRIARRDWPGTERAEEHLAEIWP